MKVVRYYRNDDVRLEEVPRPSPGPGEILVKVMASGICGSDVMEWYRIKKAPMVLGHEVAGSIAELGSDVEGFLVGQRVFVSHHIPCNTCRYCLAGHHTVCQTLMTTNFDPGGFAEYVRVPRLNVDRGVFVLPDEVSFDEGALVEPLACVVRGLRLCGFEPGQSVLVIGSGMSGLLQIALARALGAGTIMAVDIDGKRLASAKRLGADASADARGDVPAFVRKANRGFLADLVMVCAGTADAYEHAWRSVDRGGTIQWFAPLDPEIAVEIPLFDLWRNGIVQVPTYGAAPSDIARAIELIRGRMIPTREMITHRFGLSEAGEAFSLVARASDSIKVILEPHGRSGSVDKPEGVG